jgi:hypothetical protein
MEWGTNPSVGEYAVLVAIEIPHPRLEFLPPMLHLLIEDAKCRTILGFRDEDRLP